MDGTQYASIVISHAKARTGGRPSVLSVMGMTGAAASEGGFPIVIDGKLIGAIGASGGLSSQDGVTAKGGLEAIGGK